MYAVAGWARVENLGWLRGHAVFNAMANSMFSRWLIDWQPFKPVLSAMTWITYGLEPLAPIALWIPRLRVVWVYLLLAVHVGLEVLTNVGWWNLVMIASLTCFLPTAHLEAVFRRLPGGPPPARDTAVRE